MLKTKPKLSLNTSVAHSVSLKSSLPAISPGPSSVRHTPITPATARPNAQTLTNHTSEHSSASTPKQTNTSKGILKKKTSPGTRNLPPVKKRIQFSKSPTVYCMTPIENPEEYYGTNNKLSRDERRWAMTVVWRMSNVFSQRCLFSVSFITIQWVRTLEPYDRRVLKAFSYRAIYLWHMVFFWWISDYSDYEFYHYR